LTTLAKASYIATIVGAIATILSVCVVYFTGEPSRTDVGVIPVRSQVPSATPESASVTESKPEVGPTSQEFHPNPGNRPGVEASTEAPRAVANVESPIEFELRDGEQRVLLGGRVAIGIGFSRIGTVRLATLHLYADGETSNKALLTERGPFQIRAGGDLLNVSVLRLDTKLREAVVRVDLDANRARQ